MEVLTSNGFTLADYEVWSDYYLTPKALPMLRSFLESLGFDKNLTFFQALKLDEYGNPTPDTVELIAGMDVLCTTPRAGDNGRVYGRLDNCIGVKPQAPAPAPQA
jgi:hypothetical protein